MPRFTKEDMLRYYEILGISSLDKLIIRDSINLNYIGDLYGLNNLEKRSSYTTHELSNVYSLLLNVTCDDFWYEGKKRKENALVSSFEVISDLTKFSINDDDLESRIEKRNNLYITVIKGLCEVGDIIDFRLYEKNVSFKNVLSKADILEEDFVDLKKLYYLIALSKYNENENIDDIFDSLNKVLLKKLKYKVNNLDKEKTKILEFPKNRR